MTDIQTSKDIFDAINQAIMLGRGGDAVKLKEVTDKYLGPEAYNTNLNPVRGWGHLEQPKQVPDNMATAALRLYLLEQFKAEGGKARVDLELAHMPTRVLESVTDHSMHDVIARRWPSMTRSRIQAIFA